MAKSLVDFYHGADCFKPEYKRCLVALSRGGADADVTREFDLTAKQFVQDGFFRPEAKGNLAWIDRDTVYAITDLGEGSTNKAGYARYVKVWKRGTPLADAVTAQELGVEPRAVPSVRFKAWGRIRRRTRKSSLFVEDEQIAT